MSAEYVEKMTPFFTLLLTDDEIFAYLNCAGKRHTALLLLARLRKTELEEGLHLVERMHFDLRGSNVSEVTLRIDAQIVGNRQPASVANHVIARSDAALCRATATLTTERACVRASSSRKCNPQSSDPCPLQPRHLQ